MDYYQTLAYYELPKVPTDARRDYQLPVTPLQPYIGNAGAEQKLSRLIVEVEALLSNTPLAYPVSSQASLFGITHHRELNHDGYRIFYECFEAEHLVVVGLILAHKQSVEDQLIHYCLMFDR